MKTTIITLIACMGIYFSQAQEFEEVGSQVRTTQEKTSDVKTIFSSNSRVRGFGSLDFRVSEIKNNLAIMPGVHGGVILGDHLMIGVGGQGISNNISYNRQSDGQKLYLYGGYGGIMIGAIVAPKEVVHLNFPVLIGVGGIHSSSENYHRIPTNRNEPIEEKNSVILVVEPGVELEMNLTHFFKIGIGGTYRFVSESQIPEVSNSSLSGFSGNISLKFGGFR